MSKRRSRTSPAATKECGRGEVSEAIEQEIEVDEVEGTYRRRERADIAVGIPDPEEVARFKAELVSWSELARRIDPYEIPKTPQHFGLPCPMCGRGENPPLTGKDLNALSELVRGRLKRQGKLLGEYENDLSYFAAGAVAEWLMLRMNEDKAES